MTNERTQRRQAGTQQEDAAEKAPAPLEAGKRRGLSLPPRGQALSRLQDLERDAPPEAVSDPAEEIAPPFDAASIQPNNSNGIDAVRTASSTAVSDAVNSSNSETSKDNRPAGMDMANPNKGKGKPEPVLSRTASLRAVREPTTRITVDMPDSLHKRLSFLSVETRRSIKDLVIEALNVAYFQADEQE